MNEFPCLTAEDWPAIKARLDHDYRVAVAFIEQELSERGFTYGSQTCIAVKDGQLWYIGVSRRDILEDAKALTKQIEAGENPIRVVKVPL